MVGIYSLKPFKDRQLQRLAAWLIQHKVSANWITLTGLVAGFAAFICLLGNKRLLGLAFFLLSILADILDGTVARLGGLLTLRGKLIDGICDRVTETTWVTGLCCTGLLPWWGWLLPFGSWALLLVRWLGYHNGIDTSFVMVTRFERVLAILGVWTLPQMQIPWLFYLLVTGGTFFSVAAVIRRVLRETNNHLIITIKFPVMNYPNRASSGETVTRNARKRS